MKTNAHQNKTLLIAVCSLVLFNVNIGWNTLRTDIKDKSEKIATPKIDPLSLGIGLGFNF